jgi:hypothetical protein
MLDKTLAELNMLIEKKNDLGIIALSRKNIRKATGKEPPEMFGLEIKDQPNIYWDSEHPMAIPLLMFSEFLPMQCECYPMGCRDCNYKAMFWPDMVAACEQPEHLDWLIDLVLWLWESLGLTPHGWEDGLGHGPMLWRKTNERP